jgi:hypothetical protein
MNDRMSFKRNPSIQCWIKHVLEGQYNDDERFFYTIFGQVKRIRIIATIIDKKEKLVESNEVEMGIEEDSSSNVRIDFDLDDSTGMVRGIIRNVNPENYVAFNKGDIVEVVGRVSKFGDYVSLWIEILKKVKEPNLILLRNAEIIDFIKHGEIQEIPKLVNTGKNIDEIDVTTLFENEGDPIKQDDKKEKIYLIIEEYSARGSGIKFEKLKQEAKLSESELRTYLNDLILESRIYESDNDNFEAF